MKTLLKLRRIALIALVALLLASSWQHGIETSRQDEPPCHLHAQWQQHNCYENSWWWHLP